MNRDAMLKHVVLFQPSQAMLVQQAIDNLKTYRFRYPRELSHPYDRFSHVRIAARMAAGEDFLDIQREILGYEKPDIGGRAMSDRRIGTGSGRVSAIVHGDMGEDLYYVIECETNVPYHLGRVQVGDPVRLEVFVQGPAEGERDG